MDADLSDWINWLVLHIGVPLALLAVLNIGLGILGAIRRGLGSTFTATRPQSSPPVVQRRLLDRMEGDQGIAVKDIQIKGALPTKGAKVLGFVVSVFDITTPPNREPVLASVDAFQEAESRVYRFIRGVGLKRVESIAVFDDWLAVGQVVLPVLEPPVGGKRKLAVALRVVNVENIPPIRLGELVEKNHAGLVAEYSLEFEHDFAERGYKEKAELRQEARALAVHFAVHTAMRDGELLEACGLRLKAFMTKVVTEAPEAVRAAFKERMNAALRTAFTDVKTGSFKLAPLVGRMNEIAEKPLKYEAVELCFDVSMAATQSSAPVMKKILAIANNLELDSQEIERIRDLAIKSGNQVVDAVGVETLLGMSDDWSPKRKKAYLVTEFQKWNNRLNTLPEGEERANAQRMLDAIAEARRRYG
jgi:hypothetical protein